MGKHSLRQWLGLGLLAFMGLIGSQRVLADAPVVHAVLFYSPSCGHCHYVITEVLPPIMEEHGDGFQIVGVNIAEAGGQALYQAAITHFAIPDERRGVPTLIMGETVLVGSGEIPEQLPGLIETYLAQGGLDWPAIPGLAEALAASASTPEPETPLPTPEPNTPSPTPESAAAPSTAAVAATPTAAATLPPTVTAVPVIPGVVTDDGGWRARFARDPLGNGISIAVLLGMIASVLYNGIALLNTPSEAAQRRWQWAIPPLVVLGLIVAGYLAYVETQQVAAVCGPVGDCNAVQQSEFALLFGFLPIAVLGLIGYVGIGAAWAVARYADGLWANLAKLALVGMAWFGIVFSIYLTFLEPFVIGATCAWCLTSAVVMTALFWVITPLTSPTWSVLRAARRAPQPEP
ncbi:MAG TPA: vitamin K epoxide reductase family protein [Anaerolineae bacterium]|nr:vitamin K epoxide reductase family protein [Anaerolineae bacterium]HQH39383.1 vitamin K epoxide reductase family protein [Anaerolineae bacterium]